MTGIDNPGQIAIGVGGEYNINTVLRSGNVGIDDDQIERDV